MSLWGQSTERLPDGSSRTTGWSLSGLLTVGTFTFLGWILLGSVAIFDSGTMILVIIGVVIMLLLRSK